MTGTLPSGVVSRSWRRACVLARRFTCSDTGLTAGATTTFTVHVTVASSTLPGRRCARERGLDRHHRSELREQRCGHRSHSVSIITRADLQASISAPGGTQYVPVIRPRGLLLHRAPSPTTALRPQGRLHRHRHAAGRVRVPVGHRMLTATGGVTCTDSTALVPRNPTATAHVFTVAVKVDTVRTAATATTRTVATGATATPSRPALRTTTRRTPPCR